MTHNKKTRAASPRRPFRRTFQSRAALMAAMALLAVQLPAFAQGAAAPAPAAPASANAGPSFVLKEIQLPATQAVPQQDLRALLQPYVGKPLNNADLRAIVERVRQLYEDRGLGLAAIGLPTQDVTRGTLTLAIVEPRINRMSVAASEAPPLREARVRGMLGFHGVRAGGWLDVLALDKAMFALNDLPGVSAKATLGASGDEGAYDLVIEVEPRRSWDAQIEVDNHGSSSSGQYRVGGLLRWNNPLRIGDNADVRLLLSDGGGVVVGRLGYELPLAYTSARVGFGWSRVDYELGDEFAALGANGTADVYDASLTYPLLRSRGRNLVARLGLERKELEDEVAVAESVIAKRVNAGSASLNYEGRDGWSGGGFNGASVGLRFGKLAFDDPNQDDAALGDAATSGSFRKIEVQLTRLQALTRQLSLHAGLTGQFASKNLDGSEKVTLGGPKAVRAYPKAEAASDEALILGTELRWWLNPQWTVFALADVARGKLQKRPLLDPLTGEPPPGNKRTLKATGIGVYFSNPTWFTLTATLAARGDEPVQSEPGNDKQQLFLQLSRAF